MRVWKVLSRYIEKGFLKARNGLIIGGAVLGFAFMDGVAMQLYPITIGVLLLFFSIIYYLFFELPKENKVDLSRSEFDEIKLLLQERRDNLTPIILKIVSILESFKNQHQARYSIISNYMCDIIEFESIVPELVRNYRKAFDYVGNTDGRIDAELMDLKRKIEVASNEGSRETYKKAFAEKEDALNEVKKIRDNMEQTESNLYFILSALEKIEALIKSSELTTNPPMKDTEKMGEQFEVFSQSIKDMSKNMNF